MLKTTPITTLSVASIARPCPALELALLETCVRSSVGMQLRAVNALARAASRVARLCCKPIRCISFFNFID
jgi:hypothetical protein